MQSKFEYRLIAVFVSLALLLAACAPPTPVVVEKEVPVTVEVEKEVVVEKEVPVTVEVEKVVTATPVPAKRGGTLVMSIYGASVTDTLNQHLTSHTGSNTVASHVQDRLVAFNPEDRSIHPWLATSWEISPDGLVYTFKLREDVKFHDGAPFNAEAVKYNFDYNFRPDITPGPPWGYLGGSRYEKTEVVDDYTVEVHFNAPHPTFLLDLACGLGFDSPTAMEEAGDDYGTTVFVGTGPFKFVEWVVGDHVTLERNDEYNWAPEIFKHNGPPYLDQLIYRDILDASARTVALEVGEVHVARLLESQVAGFEGSEDVQIVIVERPGSTNTYYMNLGRPPTDDIRVRRAINHAIDKEALVQLPYWAGLALPGLAPMPSVLMGDLSRLEQYDYKYDPEKAKQLLEEAGWTDKDGDGIREKDGEKLILEGISTTGRQPQMEPVAEMLRDVGIQVNLQAGDYPWLAATRDKGEFHICISQDFGPSPLRLLYYFYHSESAFNCWNYSGADKYIDAARDAPNQEVMEENIWLAMAQIMQDAVGVQGFEGLMEHGIRKEVHDIFWDEVAYPHFYDTWIEQE